MATIPDPNRNPNYPMADRLLNKDLVLVESDITILEAAIANYQARLALQQTAAADIRAELDALQDLP